MTAYSDETRMCLDDTKDDDRILSVIRWHTNFSGRKLSIKNTDIKDTYHWRYAKFFVNWMDQNNISWSLAKNIIYYAIKYAKINNLNHGNMSFLARKDIIQLCYKMMNEEVLQMKRALSTLKSSFDFVKQHNFALLHRSSSEAYPNIIMWYLSKSICDDYIALSQACEKAMKALDEHELALLPSGKRIGKKRLLCLMDKNYYQEAKNILNGDFIAIGG